MALRDVTADTSVAHSARTIRRAAKSILATMLSEMKVIVAEVNAQGKNPLATELGSDATEFANFYDNIRTELLAFDDRASTATAVPTRASLPATV